MAGIGRSSRGYPPSWLAADTAYGTARFLDWIIGTGITPYVPVRDMNKRPDRRLSRADFTLDKERKVYVCPQDNLLRTTGKIQNGRTILYLASARDCGPRSIKPKRTPNMSFRKIPRAVREGARDAARALEDTRQSLRNPDTSARRSRCALPT